jgi:hypothetical protein
MADKQVKVKVDVETNVEPSIAALKQLKKQLKETAAGSEDFKLLQQQINDTEDAIKAARTGAGNFTEVLGQLPGPIGDIGNKVSGAVNTLKQFGSLKLTDIKASFVEFGKDLADAAAGLGELTGITKLYTTLNGALAASFVKVGVGEAAAAAGAKALSAALIATGIGALIVLLGTAASALYELATGEKEAAAAADVLNRALETQNQLLDLNQAAANRRNRVELAQLKAQGASAQKIRETQFRQAKETYEQAYKDEQEAVRIYNENLGKADKEGLKKLTDNLNKRQQATKDAYATAQEVGLNNKAEELKEEQDKNKQLSGKSKAFSDAKIAEKKRELAELKKGLEDARLATLSAKDKELEEVKIKYDDLKAKAIKYGEDTKVIEQARLKENTAIAEKYAIEDKEKADKIIEDKLNSETLALDLRVAKGEMSEDEYQLKLYEIRKQYALTNDDLVKAEIDLEKYKTDEKKKLAEEERGILAIRIQSQIEALDAENARIEGDFEQDLQRLAEKKTLLAEQERNELANTELTEFQKTEIRKKYADARKNVSDQEIATEKAATQAKHDINMAYLQLFQQFGNLLSQIAGKNKALAIAGIVISQAASIGQIVANTGIANAKAVAASPLTFGAPWVLINTISAGLSIASTIASAVKSIQQINSAASQGGVTGGGGGGSVGAAPNIPTPRVAGAAAPEINVGVAQNPSTAIAQSINKSQAPLKAYVVSGEVSSQQALDRRTSRAATFVGG